VGAKVGVGGGVGVDVKGKFSKERVSNTLVFILMKKVDSFTELFKLLSNDVSE